MPSPFPGMDPFLEKNPAFHELQTQFLAEAQRLLQPQLRPRYLARLERHLSEGNTWEGDGGVISLAGAIEELDPDELELRKQRRIVIYVNAPPRLAVPSLEL